MLLQSRILGPDAPEHISSLTMDSDAVWAASSLFAIKYLRGKEVRQLLTWTANTYPICLKDATVIKPSWKQSVIPDRIWPPVASSG